MHLRCNQPSSGGLCSSVRTTTNLIFTAQITFLLQYTYYFSVGTAQIKVQTGENMSCAHTSLNYFLNEVYFIKEAFFLLHYYVDVKILLSGNESTDQIFIAIYIIKQQLN